MTVADAHEPVSPRSPATGVAAPWSGVLIVDKPAGITSHDVVDLVRRRFRERHAGHLGTLDPAASGLVAVMVGAATRCAPVWQGGEKTYEATLRLGVTTSTQDTTGEILEERPVAVGADELRAASAAFVGDLMQIPPMVSAVHVGGERLYRLARRGITVERAPRPIRVRSWEWLGFDLPLATFRVRCSTGTYVRTLAHDLGARLGTGAALHALRRLESQPFDLARAASVADLRERSADEVWARSGVALDAALTVLPALALDADETAALGYGAALPIEPERAPAAPAGAGPRSVVFRDAAGRALALGDVRPDEAGRMLARPHVVFPWAVREGPRPPA